LIEDIERKIESDDLDELKEAVLLTKQLKEAVREINLTRHSWRYPKSYGQVCDACGKRSVSSVIRSNGKRLCSNCESMRRREIRLQTIKRNKRIMEGR
jgi:formate dehydrogenase maturation protein FdhE